MLELLIGLFLIGLFVFPLVQLPTRAIREEIHSSYRMQAQRLADLCFAEIKGKLIRNEIPWKDITKSLKERVCVLDDVKQVDIDYLWEKDGTNVSFSNPLVKKQKMAKKVTWPPSLSSFNPKKKA